jgi:hypothetical protein
MFRMLFTFKRDEEGRERIYVGDVCVARMRQDGPDEQHIERWLWVTNVHRVHDGHIVDAIERADKAGFWSEHLHETGPCESQWLVLCPHEVTVDVPVADNAILSVTTEDES